MAPAQRQVKGRFRFRHNVCIVREADLARPAARSAEVSQLKTPPIADILGAVPPGARGQTYRMIVEASPWAGELHSVQTETDAVGLTVTLRFERAVLTFMALPGEPPAAARMK